MQIGRRELIVGGGLVGMLAAVGASSHNGPTGRLGIGGGEHGDFVLELPAGATVPVPDTHRAVEAIRPEVGGRLGPLEAGDRIGVSA